MSKGWQISQVSQSDIVAALSLYEMFDEYSGKVDERKRDRQRQRISSHRYWVNILNPRTADSAAGYYVLDLQSPKYPGKFLFDQMFIHPDYRGQKLGTFMAAHCLYTVARIYDDARTQAKHLPKQIIGEHFRKEATLYPENLAAIKN